MRVLLAGGCKNGKSLYAQKMIQKLAGNGKKYYIATMEPVDKEDELRVKNHQKERENWGFITAEQPKDIIKVTQRCEKGSSALLDSTTALLMNEMFQGKKIDTKAHLKIIEELKVVCRHFENLVVVSDYIYSDAIKYEALTENYRFSLAQIDRFLARELDTVAEVCYGNLIYHKGGKEKCIL